MEELMCYYFSQMAVVKYGLPANICTDHGEENIVWKMMLDKHDAGNKCVIAGSSTHNELWRDVHWSVIIVYVWKPFPGSWSWWTLRPSQWSGHLHTACIMSLYQELTRPKIKFTKEHVYLLHLCTYLYIYGYILKCHILLLDTLCASAAECWTDGIRRSFLSFVLSERVPSIILSFCHLDWSTVNGSRIGIEHIH